MIRISYISTQKEGLDFLDLSEIEIISDYNNRKKGLTGILLNFGSLFYQVLEGPKEIASSLYETICEDDRHTNIRLLSSEEITERQFPDWGMKMIKLDQSNERLLQPLKELLQVLSKNTETIKQNRQAFLAYTNAELLKFIDQGNNHQEILAQKTEKIVLFSDLVSFSRITEKLEASEVIALLNMFFGLASECIGREGGEINKLIGDGFMAHFPAGCENNAVSASINLSRRLAEIRNNAPKNSVASFLNAGFGLEKGDVIIGNTGSKTKMDFTLIGDAVNTASRLEAMTRITGHSILFSDRIAGALDKTMKTISLGPQSLPGKESTVHVFTLDSTYASFNISAEYITNLIAHYVKKYGSAKKSGVPFSAPAWNV